MIFNLNVTYLVPNMYIGQCAVRMTYPQVAHHETPDDMRTSYYLWLG